MNKNICRLAVIPARGGSKRLPNKNTLDFHGKPMIAWTIEAALNSLKFDKVLVSTDSIEIAEISKFYGAEVPFLRQSAADDFSTVSDATLLALEQGESYWKQRFDSIALLMANCPLRDVSDVVKHVEIFDSSETNFQISAFEYGFSNPWWACRLDEQMIPSPLFPEALKARSQDLDRLYCPTGAIWIANRDSFKKAGTFYGPRHTYCPISWQSGTDIDEYHDQVHEQASLHHGFYPDN